MITIGEEKRIEMVIKTMIEQVIGVKRELGIVKSLEFEFKPQAQPSFRLDKERTSPYKELNLNMFWA